MKRAWGGCSCGILAVWCTKIDLCMNDSAKAALITGAHLVCIFSFYVRHSSLLCRTFLFISNLNCPSRQLQFSCCCLKTALMDPCDVSRLATRQLLAQGQGHYVLQVISVDWEGWKRWTVSNLQRMLVDILTGFHSQSHDRHMMHLNMQTWSRPECGRVNYNFNCFLFLKHKKTQIQQL